jgi:hypothetical protein
MTAGRQLGPGLLQGAQRVRQLPAQRRHQRGQHLIRRRFFIIGHTRTLRATNRRRPRFPPHRQAGSGTVVPVPVPAYDQAPSASASPVTMARAAGEGSDLSSTNPSRTCTAGWAIIRREPDHHRAAGMDLRRPPARANQLVIGSD